jgi:hypothetical protein
MFILMKNTESQKCFSTDFFSQTHAFDENFKLKNSKTIEIIKVFIVLLKTGFYF